MKRTEPFARTANVCAQTTNEHESRSTDVERLLVRLLAPLVAAEIRRTAGEEWVDQKCSPLGCRRHRELAKAGAFPARKLGRRWLARRTDIDAFIEGQGSGAPFAGRLVKDTAPDDDDDREVRAALAEARLELAPTSPRSRKGRR